MNFFKLFGFVTKKDYEDLLEIKQDLQDKVLEHKARASKFRSIANKADNLAESRGKLLQKVEKTLVKIKVHDRYKFISGNIKTMIETSGREIEKHLNIK